MSTINLAPNIARPDDFYARLVSLHDGLDIQASAVINAKLIFLLANHIGDEDVLHQALTMAAAKQPMPQAPCAQAA
ncbi:DUF2783 domain-containing protein [Novosphingobium rosa]|uniref:DUF2783 domain-containing protein n=1 Tax=Novosphingobium rosa TaxID=76978 RepID=UPI00082C9D96|nr:DUF2783 domain-containing protein [Novosphingobium rosa]